MDGDGPGFGRPQRGATAVTTTNGGQAVRQWMTEWDSVGRLVLPGPWLTAAPPYLANYKVLCPQPFR